MQIKPFLAAVLAALTFASAACSSPLSSGGAAASGDLDRVTVGVLPILDVAPIYLGKDRGFFADQGIDLNLVSGQGGAANLPSVVSGEFQFASSNLTSLLTARDQGLDVRAVAPVATSTGVAGSDVGAVVAPADSPIRSAKDLEGRTVAVNTLQNIGDTTVRASVEKDSGDAKAVNFVELPFPDMPSALESGRVDAAWVVEPFLSMATKAGAKVVAWNYVDTATDLTIAAYFTTGELAESNPDLVRRFNVAMHASTEYAQANPDEVRQILTSYTKIPADLIDALTLPAWTTEFNEASTQTLANLAYANGVVAKRPDVKELLP